MRVRLIFRLKNKGAVLPFHHQRLVHSFLQEVAGTHFLLDEQMVSFSGVKGQTKVTREGLSYYSRRVTLVFSSMNDQLVEKVIDLLFQKNHVMLGNLILEPEFVEEEIPPVFNEKSSFLCISPVVIKNSTDNLDNKQFIHPTTDQFSDLLYDSVMVQMERSGMYTAEDLASYFKFQIVPDHDYLERLAVQEKKFARIYTLVVNGDLKEVRGYTFPFKLYAAPEVQSFVFFSGLGELTHQGFGMVDLVDNSQVKRNVIHKKDLPDFEISENGRFKEEEFVTIRRPQEGQV